MNNPLFFLGFHEYCLGLLIVPSYGFKNQLKTVTIYHSVQVIINSWFSLETLDPRHYGIPITDLIRYELRSICYHNPVGRFHYPHSSTTHIQFQTRLCKILFCHTRKVVLNRL